MKRFSRRLDYQFWLLLILLTAVFLRFYLLATIPPGLTHDEAAHGLTAVSILNGTRGVYFTIGHGREPLFDYAAAGLMALVGQTVWALRGTAVLFSLLMIAGMVAWTRQAFNRRVALLTAAGLAVGFWPVMAARQGLRSITLPALFVLALYFFWRGLQNLPNTLKQQGPSRRNFSLFTSHWTHFLLSGLCLGLTFYTYMPARGLWLLFPALLLIGGFINRRWLRQVWPGTLLQLGLAAVLAVPLFAYLRANPGAEIRIRELSEPLTAVLQGDVSLLWANIKAGLAIFTEVGDMAWRYNIAGSPLLGPLLGLLFFAGIGLAVWESFRRSPRPAAAPCGRLAHAAAVIWLIGGLAPVLITGPELSMTQGMGMQPVVYLFPAIALDRLWRVVSETWPVIRGRWQHVGVLGVVLLFGAIAAITWRDYFDRWANAPEVRVQYESTLMAVLTYLQERPATPAAVSTIAPGPFHSPAVARLTLPEDAGQPHWFDGRNSLLLPQAADGLILFSGFAPLPAALEPYLATAVLQDTLPLRPTDQDRPVWVYRVDAAEAVANWQTRLNAKTAGFGSSATLLGYELSAESVPIGGTVWLITVWRLEEAQPDLRLFTHLVEPDGRPVAQADRLDAPSSSWVAGDLLVQLHELVLPLETAVGRYPLIVGLYHCLDNGCTQTQRLEVIQDGAVVGDSLQLTDVEITE